MENNTTTSSAPKGYVPPKEWKEINDSEKIERMREIIKSLQQNLHRQSNEIYNLRSNFKKHYHHHDNEVVVPFNEYENNSIGLGGAVNSVGGFF